VGYLKLRHCCDSGHGGQGPPFSYNGYGVAVFCRSEVETLVDILAESILYEAFISNFVYGNWV
jgi:hypothetical protein